MNKDLAEDISYYIGEALDSGVHAPTSVVAFKQKLDRALADRRIDDKSRKYHHDYMLPFTVYGSRCPGGSDVGYLQLWAAIKTEIEARTESLPAKVGRPVNTTEVAQ
jgi:hypothetical protein